MHEQFLAAILYTVVASAARHSLDVWAYLRDVLVQLAVGDAKLVNLLPDVGAPRIPIQSVPIVATSAKLKPWLNALVATAAEHSNESRRSAASSEKKGRPVRLHRATVFPEF